MQPQLPRRTIDRDIRRGPARGFIVVKRGLYFKESHFHSGGSRIGIAPEEFERADLGAVVHAMAGLREPAGSADAALLVIELHKVGRTNHHVSFQDHRSAPATAAAGKDAPTVRGQRIHHRISANADRPIIVDRHRPRSQSLLLHRERTVIDDRSAAVGIGRIAGMK